MAVHFVRITNSAPGNSHGSSGPGSVGNRRHRRRRVSAAPNRLRRSPVRAPPPPPASNQAVHDDAATLDDAAASSSPPDSFTRLVSLRLEVEATQPYAHLGTPPGVTPTFTREIYVRYHDVDGVLDFLILRSVFDGAINRTWAAGLST